MGALMPHLSDLCACLCQYGRPSAVKCLKLGFELEDEQ